MDRIAVPIAAVTTAFVYSGYVEIRHRRISPISLPSAAEMTRIDNRPQILLDGGITSFKGLSQSDPSYHPNLSGADAIILDSLRTGDIVLFQRSWHRHHIPMSLAISNYHNATNTEYDHAGVVFVNPWDGMPFVLERQPFSSSLLLTRMDHRLLFTDTYKLERQVLVMSLDNASVRNIDLSDMKAANQFPMPESSECLNLYDYLISSYARQFAVWRRKPIICPNAQFIFNCYKLFGLDVNLNDKHSDVNLKSIVDRKVSFIRRDESQKKIQLSAEDMLIRSRFR